MTCKLDRRKKIEWGNFYPKRAIQIGGVELSKQISHINFFIQKSYQKILSKDLLDLFNITLGRPYFIHKNSYTTYSTLLYW